MTYKSIKRKDIHWRRLSMVMSEFLFEYVVKMLQNTLCIRECKVEKYSSIKWGMKFRASYQLSDYTSEDLDGIVKSNLENFVKQDNMFSVISAQAEVGEKGYCTILLTYNKKNQIPAKACALTTYQIACELVRSGKLQVCTPIEATLVYEDEQPYDASNCHLCCTSSQDKTLRLSWICRYTNPIYQVLKQGKSIPIKGRVEHIDLVNHMIYLEASPTSLIHIASKRQPTSAMQELKVAYVGKTQVGSSVLVEFKDLNNANMPYIWTTTTKSSLYQCISTIHSGQKLQIKACVDSKLATGYSIKNARFVTLLN